MAAALPLLASGGGAAGGAGAAGGLSGGQVAGAGLGSAIKLGKDLFGEASSQATAGETRRRLQFRPEDLASIQAQQERAQQRGQLLSDFAGQLQQQAFRSAPQLGQIQSPIFQQGLDPLSQALVSQGQQALAQGAAAQQQALANQFRQQPGVARALAAQSANRAALQANPLLFQAAQQQRGREVAENQLRLQSQQAANQALLQQQAAQQAARGEAFGFGQAGQALESGLLGQLANLGQLRADSVQSIDQKTRGRSGGLFNK